jgi:VanZ family protein
MSLSRTSIIIFRIMFIVSLLLIAYLTTTELEHPVMTSVNDKLGHVPAFIYLAFLVDYSFPASRFGLLKILPLLAYGLFIEVIQHYLPHRMFSFLDMLADGVGVVIYALFIPLLMHIPLLKHRWVTK